MFPHFTSWCAQAVSLAHPTRPCPIHAARYKLAQLVQYLPLPVIGGYLSFVGYFCVASGIGLGVSQDIGSIARWVQVGLVCCLAC